ncbi:MAG: hypothetical protein L0Y72_25975 [Gemmataceae bacterium]|nr:hypothetical protein [Gemmataceae bacterium]MCI0742495.1 hypothetical protein [Gemmataceae bacterium]
METAVICEVFPGLRHSERTVAVANVHGRKEYLRIEGSYIRPNGEGIYLPVGLISEHPASGSVLIELPLEADSGVRRMFVPKENVLVRERVPA